MELTEKQRRFADEYIRTGNISESYRNAYPNVKKDSAARASGSRLLTNANVKSYVEERMEVLKSDNVADQQEIMEFLTSVVRGEVTEPVAILDGGGRQRIEYLPPSVQTRRSAAVDLGKRYVMWTDKQQIDADIGINVVVDYGDTPDD